VTVNAIAPGALTRMTEPLSGSRAAPEAGAWDERAPDNVAPLVTWLASPESAGVTGQVFLVSGGRIAIATGWGRGSGVDRGAKWEPDEVGAVVHELTAEAQS
jgi:NAD(P)-dependent dehydrogenase (short-subunit alcohol dehydrogenase family)